MPAATIIACARSIGTARRYYSTPETVADIEQLRRALGARRLTIDGVSYGTFVAERYALQEPAHVARLVLDSVVPQSGVDPLYRAALSASGRVLRAVCAAQRCPWNPAADLAAVDLARPWDPAAPRARRARALAALADLVVMTPHTALLPFDRATATGNGLAQGCLDWPATSPPDVPDGVPDGTATGRADAASVGGARPFDTSGVGSGRGRPGTRRTLARSARDGALGTAPRP